MVSFGVELESEVNGALVSVQMDGYHGSNAKYLIPTSRNWKCERDGSLNCSKFPSGIAVEIISKKAENTAEMKQMLEEFKTFFRTAGGGNHELKEILNYNNSMGCHIHFSEGKKFKFFKNMTFRGYMQMRVKFFQLLDSSKVIPKATRDKIKAHYGRSYSSLLTRKDYSNMENRRNEFNFNSEKSGNGLEWRSFNILGVETWAEFDEMFRIAFETIEFFCNNRGKFDETLKFKATKKILNTKAEELGDCEIIIESGKHQEVNLTTEHCLSKLQDFNINNKEEFEIDVFLLRN